MHIAFAIFGMAVMLGLDTLVSQAYGARDIRECHRWFFDGLTLAGLMAVPIMALLRAGLVRHPVAWLSQRRPAAAGVVLRRADPEHAVPARLRGVPPLPAGDARGHAGDVRARHRQPDQRRGQLGADLRTLRLSGARRAGIGVGHGDLARLHAGVAAVRGVVDRSQADAQKCAAREPARRALAKADMACGMSIARSTASRLRRLLALGLPAASQVAAEVGVFALATAMSGMLDPISSASHQIALNMAGVAFMIPLGLGSAGAVRVGHAVGAGDRPRAAAAGWTAILLATLVMVASGLTFVLIPEPLIGLFTTDPSVLSVGTSLLLLAAMFQLFDGIQGVITGTLRGLGNTRIAMNVNLVAHWLLGLPVSYLLCFVAGWGVWGLWIGLSLGLIVTGVILFWVWTVKIAHYVRGD